MLFKIVRTAFFLALIAEMAYPQAVIGARFGIGRDYVPAPRLIYPVSETADFTGKDTVIFKWSPHEGIMMPGSKYYDLRIYKGYEMLESTLVYKEKVAGNRCYLEVKTDLFENGEVYTWSVRLVCNPTGKSDRSFCSFRVVKPADPA